MIWLLYNKETIRSKEIVRTTSIIKLLITEFNVNKTQCTKKTLNFPKTIITTSIRELLFTEFNVNKIQCTEESVFQKAIIYRC